MVDYFKGKFIHKSVRKTIRASSWNMACRSDSQEALGML